MMNSTLQVRLEVTYRGEPLATVDLPGEGAELTPARLRALSAALAAVADDCEANAKRPKPRKGAHVVATVARIYALVPSNSEDRAAR